MTTIEKLTARINACTHRRQIYNTLLVLAPLIREDRAEQRHIEPLEAIKEGAKKNE